MIKIGLLKIYIILMVNTIGLYTQLVQLCNLITFFSCVITTEMFTELALLLPETDYHLFVTIRVI